MKFKPGIYKVGDTNSDESMVLSFVETRKKLIFWGVLTFTGIFTTGIYRNFSDGKMHLGMFFIFLFAATSLYLLNKNAQKSMIAFRHTWFQILDKEIIFYDLIDGQKTNIRKISDVDLIKIFPHLPSGGYQLEVPRFKIFPSLKKN